MLLSLEEAIAILNKWKDERASLLVLGQNVFRLGLRSVHEGGVDWNMSLGGKLVDVSVSQGTLSPDAVKVVFESPGGNLSLLMDACSFSYSAPCETPPFVKREGHSTIVSCLFIFFPSNEAFVVYEIRES